jgi:hypothetical protein
LADIQHNLPDDELLLLAFEYAPYRVVTIFDGIDKTAVRDDGDTKRFLSIHDNPLSVHEQICLAEAGLIRYFEPRYNEIYKDSFPASDQKILDHCYELDFLARETAGPPFRWRDQTVSEAHGPCARYRWPTIFAPHS